MVIDSKDIYNLSLGRELIHGIGAVPSTLHQRISIWRKDGIIENIEADQGYCKIDDNKDGIKSFDQYLANVASCYDAIEVYTPNKNIGQLLNLDPHCGFSWDTEGTLESEGENPPTCWTEFDNNDH